MVHLHVVPTDRRERTREKRRQAILAAADDLIAEEGLSAVTMQGVADRLDCAVGTLYLYFDSKAALVEALAGAAVATLRASYLRARDDWDRYLESERVAAPDAALVRLWAFGSHWIAASVVFGDEFHLQRAVLSGDPDASPTVPAATTSIIDTLVDPPRSLLADAASAAVLADGDAEERALVWLTGLNGVLVLEGIASLAPARFRTQHLARLLSRDLLRAWGAEPGALEAAMAHVERLAALAPLAPPPDDGGSR